MPVIFDDLFNAKTKIEGRKKGGGLSSLDP